MKYTFYLVIFLLISCTYQNKISTTYIEGESMDMIGTTIYLKDNDHFNFLIKDFELDSVVVDSSGKFKFEIELKEALLVKLDTNDNIMPGTLQVFKESPQFYQYLLCKNFLAYHPTLYIEPGKKYKIQDWKKGDETSAVVYGDDSHNLLRRYYIDNPYYDAVRLNRKLRDLEIAEAWLRLNKVKDSLIKAHNLNKTLQNDSFKHYLKTEIVLGASNWFFNWFDGKEMIDFNNEVYTEALNVYFSEDWNKRSLQYFKLTERLVNTKLNQKHDSYKVYYEPSLEKLKLAKQFAGKNIVEQYCSNIEKLIK